jgi:hypothetical protein
MAVRHESIKEKHEKPDHEKRRVCMRGSRGSVSDVRAHGAWTEEVGSGFRGKKDAGVAHAHEPDLTTTSTSSGASMII